MAPHPETSCLEFRLFLSHEVNACGHPALQPSKGPFFDSHCLGESYGEVPFKMLEAPFQFTGKRVGKSRTLGEYSVHSLKSRNNDGNSPARLRELHPQGSLYIIHHTTSKELLTRQWWLMVVVLLVFPGRVVGGAWLIHRKRQSCNWPLKDAAIIAWDMCKLSLSVTYKNRKTPGVGQAKTGKTCWDQSLLKAKPNN